MKISRLQLHSIAIADSPLRSSYGRHAPWALRTIVELTTTDGIRRSARLSGATVREPRWRRGNRIIGMDPFQLTGLYQEMLRSAAVAEDVPGGRSQTWLVPGENPLDRHNRTFAAIEIACLDIIGKVVGKPVCDLLGGRVRDRVPFSAYLFYKHGGGGGDGTYHDKYGEVLDPAAAVRECRQMIDEYGFREIKLKGGVLEPEREIETIKQLRDAFGPKVPLRSDPNCAWSIGTSVTVGESLREELSGGGYLEDPCPS